MPVTLVTGGARSGKSQHALELAGRFAHRAFIATAEPFDPEMRERIARHRRERDGFATLEEPVDLAGALSRLPAGTEVAVVDCLTVWLGNLAWRREPEPPPTDPEAVDEVRALLEALKSPPCELILVTNELGLGITPENAMARAFRDLAGRLNQQVAARAERVVLLVSGIPWTLKEAA